jgi:DNA ligase (NAD+)
MDNIENLLNKIETAIDEYYNKNQSSISDEEFDGLKDQLQLVYDKKQFPSKLETRITKALKQVGADISDDSPWEKVAHEVAMLSLNKVNTPEEFIKWWEDRGKPALLSTEKLDGLSVSLKYEKGKLVQGLTRGNGSIGEDITRNVKKMKGVPSSLKESFSGHIRGEIIIRKSDLSKIDNVTNARNGASGVAKRLDGTDSEHLSVVSYKIEGRDFKTEEESIGTIKTLGFVIPNYKVVKTAKDVNAIWQEYMETTRAGLDYEIDGLVICINDCALQFAQGELNNRPNGSVAFKFTAPEARTKIKEIVCQVGDTGRITPVAKFDKVYLIGAEIEKASLHNFSNISSLGAGIGAEIIVKRSNDVIPYITKVVVKGESVFSPPKICPDCGTKTVFSGEYLCCPNKKTCPQQVVGRLNKWIGELGILEWGEKILKKLIEAKLVTDVADLYKLKVEDIANLDRMGEKSAQNLIGELDKYREIPLENLIGGLNIEGVATSTAKALVSQGYDTLDKILALSVDEFASVPGFGSIRAQNFHSGLIDNADRINDILEAGVTIKSRAVGKLTGKSFCVTGTTSVPRAKLHKMIEEAGGEVKKSVGKGLTYLVSAEADSNSSKAQAAKKNGVKVISESNLMDMLKKL